MLNGKYISSAEIVDRVIRDSGVKVPFSDAIDWVAEVLDLIAVPMSYVQKVQCLEVEEFQTRIPHDLVQFKQVGRKGLKGSTIPHFTRVVLDFTKGSEFNINLNADQDCPIIPMRMTSNNMHEHLVCDECENQISDIDHTYSLTDGYIKTNFRKGEILVSYMGYPVDCDGFPLIPDDEKFKQAVQWYIQSKIDYKLWRQNKLAGDVYQKTEQERNWYIGAAQNSGNMPSVDQMETWKNMYLRLIPDNSAHNDFFNSIGHGEHLHKSRTRRGRYRR